MLSQAATIIIAITVLLGSLAVITVGLRFYCRWLQKQSFGVDDYLIVIAVLLSTGMNILCDYVTATTGVGQASYIPTLEVLIFALKCNYAGENANIAGVGIVKVSFLFFYRRIFVQRWFRRANSALIVLVILFTLSILLVIMFDKWPISAQWDPAAPYTINAAAVLIIFTSCNVVIDILTLTMPLVALQSVQISQQRKIILSTLFTVGSLCIVASILRLYYGVKFINSTQTAASLFRAPFILNSLWANIELPSLIIAANLLNLGPLFKAVVNSFRSLKEKNKKATPFTSSAENNKKPEAPIITKHISIMSATAKDEADDYNACIPDWPVEGPEGRYV